VIRLDVKGSGQTDEREAAESLQRLMREFWVGIDQDRDSDVRILVDVNCSGQRVKDIDIVVLAVFANPPKLKVPARENGLELGRFLLGSLCAVIEVKSHPPDAIKMHGDSLCVKYRDDWHDATRQNGQQVHSLVRHLEHRGVSAPYVYNFIWLRNVARGELAQGRSENNPLPHNLLFKDSGIGNLLTSVWTDWQARHPNTLLLYDDELLIDSDRHTNAPTDFNAISRALTGQEMSLLPARASSVAYADRRGIGYRRNVGSLPNSSTDHYSQRRRRDSLTRFVKSLPALLFLLLVLVGGSLIGIQRLLAWIRPVVETPRPASAEFAAFEGKYKCQRKSESYVLTISRESDRLYASSAKGRVELLPVSKNEFRGSQELGGSRSTFAFNRNAKGKVMSLTINGNAGQKSVCQPLD
jgi:hypothetical protein